MEKQRRINNKMGYTLVEMIVVCVILVILAGVAVVGFTAYQRNAMFKKNNEYAQTIFIAAQTAMSQAKDSGQAEELDELIEKEDAGNELTSAMVKNGAKTEIQKAEAQKSRLYYYIYSKNDQKENYSEAKKEVYELIRPYLYDADIADASFCIEFDPLDGMVYSVLYNDRADTLHYGGGESTEKNNDLTDRSEEARKQVLLGYYGVDNLSDQMPGPAKKNLLSDVRLVNGEELELIWKAGKTPLQYIYQIRLYNADTKKIAASLKLNDVDIADSMIKDSKADDAYVKCTMTLYSYDEKGKRTSKKLKDVKFRAVAVKEGEETTCRLVLDAVDLEAAKVFGQLSGKDQDDPEKYMDTYSVRRLGLSDTSLYARMQVCGVNLNGRSENILVSTWKQTKAESTYFASEEKQIHNKTTSVNCKIGNARHLFNIRFTEGTKEQEEKTKDTADGVNYTYLQTADIYWDHEDTAKEKQGIAQKKKIYEKQKVLLKDFYFPGIEKLHLKNQYSAGDDKTKKNYSITGLHFYKEGISKTEELLGLFGENEGTVKSLNVKNSDAVGKNVDYVGMICGLNNGKLSDISVDRESEVSGKSYVGGIAGSDITGKQYEITGGDGRKKAVLKFENERQYERLSNEAAVKGDNFTGGITGYIYGIHGESEETLTVKECTNTGLIESTAAEGICRGGIAGYSRKTRFEECTSTAALNEEEKKTLREDAATGKLKGYFAGGIAGYVDGGTFVHCISGASDNAEDYISGKAFVGGFVGFYTDSEDAEVKTASGKGITASAVLDNTKGTDQNSRSESNTNVIGEKYAGGVTSIAGGLEGDIAGLLKLEGTQKAGDVKVSKDYKGGGVKQYTYRGMTVAGDCYAGGITGYNTGILEDCITDMSHFKEDYEALLEFAKSCIESEDDERGHGDYTGGIAGFNSGTISKEGETGYISGIAAGHNYTGGIVGWNDQKGKITNYIVDDSYISGGNFTGGYAGLNRNRELIQEQLEAYPKKVEGSMYAGGLIGGNIISLDGAGQAVGSFLSLESTETEIKGEAFSGGYIGYNKIVADNYNEDEAKALADIIWDGDHAEGIVESVRARDNSASDSVEWQISGKTNQSSLSFKGLESRIYAGGILGYNAGISRVTLTDITSNTPIICEGVIKDADGREYSYAGGITGHVTSNMKLEGCRNLAVQELKPYLYAYMGGLTELNEGAIEHCFADSVIQSDRGQIGGIAGINRGTIKGLQTEKGTVTVQGTDQIGGVACINEGIIQDIDLAGSVTGNSQVGGIAASSCGVIENCVNKADVRGNEYAGGIAGVIQGQTDIVPAMITGSVNLGTVSGGDGYSSAGIVGGVASSVETKLVNCRNYGLPDTVDGNTFSGIVGLAESQVTLSNCFGVADCAYPVAAEQENITDDGAYYFSGEEEEPDEPDEPDEGEVPEIVDAESYALKGQGSGRFKKLFDGEIVDGKLDTGLIYDYTPDPEHGEWPDGWIKLSFKKPVFLNSIEIYWQVQGAKAYKARLELFDEAGNIIYQSENTSFTPDGYNYEPQIFKLEPGVKASEMKLYILDNTTPGGIEEICFNGLPVSAANSARSISELSMFAATDVQKGIGTPLYVKEDNLRYSASNEAAGIYIENGLTSNPLDEAFNADISSILAGQEGNNKRYQMYQSIDKELRVRGM